MLQPRQNDLLARFFDLSCQKYFVEYSVDLGDPASASALLLSTRALQCLSLKAPASSSRNACNKKQSPTYLVEIEDQIQLANIPKKAIQHLHKEMYCLQIRQLVVVGIHTDTEEQACVAAINYFQGAELDEVGLMFLVSRRDETVDLLPRIGGKLRICGRQRQRCDSGRG